MQNLQPFYGNGITDPTSNPDVKAPTNPISAPLTTANPVGSTYGMSDNGAQIAPIAYNNGATLNQSTMRFVDRNQAGRGATYQGPVAFMNNSIISETEPNNGGYNQFMWELTTHFDPMMQKDDMDHPRWWYNRIPRSAYKLFDGTVHETRIFRGGLYSYAGLSRWKEINPVPTTENDPCSALPYTTVKYGWESLQWTGRKTAWGSDPICLDMFKYMDQAVQQLAWILDVGAQEGIQIQEVWNRDMFIYQSVAFRRSFVMTKDFFNPATAARYYYNPFADPDAITGNDELKKVINGRAYALIPAGQMPEPLNFDVLDQFRESLKIRCPRSAVSSAGGDPMFALAVSHDDVERYIRGNEEERRYWIEADPNALIKHYGFAPSTFRRWVITNDGNQLRFTIVAKITMDDTVRAQFNDEKMTKLDVPDGDYFVAVAVPPRIASTSRVGINGTPIPEDNPEYYMAELAIAPVFMNHVFTNQMVPDLSSLGSGTKFGPNAGLNGVWKWINILDRETNPLGNKGNFYGIFEIFPKPEMSVVHTTSFMYRRCVAALPSYCPAENVKIIEAATAESTTLQAAAEVVDGTATLVLGERLAGVKVGSILTVTGPYDGSDSDSESDDGSELDVIVVGMPSLTALRVQIFTEGKKAMKTGKISSGAAVALKA